MLLTNGILAAHPHHWLFGGQAVVATRSAIDILFRVEPTVLMPYVNVRITKDGVTAAQKAQIVAEMTQTLQRVLGKRPEHTHIVIDEIEPENWGFAGLPTTEFRKKQQG